MAYMDCPECGKTMLSIATQCPHCGYQFPPQQLKLSIPPPRARMVRPALVVALALVALAAVVVAFQSWRGSSSAGVESGVAIAPPPATERQQPVETTLPDTAAVGQIGQDSQPRGPVADTTPAVAAPAPVLPPLAATPTGQQSRRYASTWVNVRRDRGRDAPTVRVLEPGDAVLVDSLDQGWYRVSIGGQPVGYAHRSNLVVRAP